MNFTEAMQAAKNGKRVARAAWSHNESYIIYDTDLMWGSKDHAPQHYHPMQDDIFAEDWEIK